jgi:hypothetical protein
MNLNTKVSTVIISRTYILSLTPGHCNAYGGVHYETQATGRFREKVKKSVRYEAHLWNVVLGCVLCVRLANCVGLQTEQHISKFHWMAATNVSFP